MKNISIEAKNLGKQYNLNLTNDYDTLRDMISDIPQKIKNRFSGKENLNNKFWALDKVSFKIERGDVVGLIGRNGAGKSTLLKILARIITPTTGVVKMNGKVASILEVGTGFHPELTGRENVYLNGAILGMKRGEINKKFKSIVEFSEIGKFLDVPVKRYSSGMQVRLAFSVASHLEAEILLIDEVLAVGDLGFRKKSLEKMQAIASEEGRTIVFVSHSMPSVQSLCKKAILLEEGKIAVSGEVDTVIGNYIDNYVSSSTTPILSKTTTRTGSGAIRIIDFWIENEKGNKTKFIKSGDEISFVFKFICPKARTAKKVDLGFSVKSITGQPLFLHYMSYTNQVVEKCPREGKFKFKIPKFALASGKYTLGFRVTSEGIEADNVQGVNEFVVEDGDFYKTGTILQQKHSPIFIDGSWKTQ